MHIIYIYIYIIYIYIIYIYIYAIISHSMKLLEDPPFKCNPSPFILRILPLFGKFSLQQQRIPANIDIQTG